MTVRSTATRREQRRLAGRLRRHATRLRHLAADVDGLGHLEVGDVLRNAESACRLGAEIVLREDPGPVYAASRDA